MNKPLREQIYLLKQELAQKDLIIKKQQEQIVKLAEIQIKELEKTKAIITKRIKEIKDANNNYNNALYNIKSY